MISNKEKNIELMQIYINISNALGIVCLHMIFQKQAERFFILFKSSIFRSVSNYNLVCIFWKIFLVLEKKLLEWWKTDFFFFNFAINLQDLKSMYCSILMIYTNIFNHFTCSFTLECDGPWWMRIFTMSTSPLQAAKWIGK